METIYIETTVVSYLVANPSRDSILAAHQQLTRQWWQDERQRYQCVTTADSNSHFDGAPACSRLWTRTLVMNNCCCNGETQPFVWLKPVENRRSVKMGIAGQRKY